MKASDRQEFLNHIVAGAFLGASSSLAVLGARPQQAGAFCGEPYPYWAYYTDFDEAFVPFEFEGYSGKVFTRTVGNKKEQRKVRNWDCSAMREDNNSGRVLCVYLLRTPERHVCVDIVGTIVME